MLIKDIFRNKFFEKYDWAINQAATLFSSIQKLLKFEIRLREQEEKHGEIWSWDQMCVIMYKHFTESAEVNLLFVFRIWIWLGGGSECECGYWLCWMSSQQMRDRGFLSVNINLVDEIVLFNHSIPQWKCATVEMYEVFWQHKLWPD